MISSQDLSESFARNTMIIKKQTDGLTHEDSLRQLPSGSNCLNWVLGHIVAYRDKVLGLLGETPLMGANGVRYERESNPVTGMDEHTFPLEDLLSYLERSQEGITAGLSRMDEAALARELTFRGQKVTVGKQLFTIFFHEAYHTGQTELFRQLAGKNDKVI